MYYTILFANYVILFGLWPVPDGASQLRFSTVCLHNNVCCVILLLLLFYYTVGTYTVNIIKFSSAYYIIVISGALYI